MSFFYNETIRRRKIRNMGKEEKKEGKKNGGKKSIASTCGNTVN